MTHDKKQAETWEPTPQDAQGLGRNASEAQRQYVRAVAHDLRNALTPLLGYVQLTLHALQPQDDLYDRMEKIHLAANSVRDLVSRILDAPTSETTERPLLDCNDEVQTFAQTAGGLPEEEIPLDVCLDTSIGSINVNRSDFQRILMNLVVNARQAITGQGTVSIRTSGAQADPKTSAQEAGETFRPRYVKLTVQDTGCGMAPETVRKVFERGFTTKATGTGLGLANVQQIVRLSKGWIEIDSIPGVGTAVHVYFPCEETIQANPTGQAPKRFRPTG